MQIIGVCVGQNFYLYIERKDSFLSQVFSAQLDAKYLVSTSEEPLVCLEKPGAGFTDYILLVKETHPDLPPLNQGTISKIEAQYREMGHIRKVPSKRQAVVDDDTKLNLLLALEENPITPARERRLLLQGLYLRGFESHLWMAALYKFLVMFMVIKITWSYATPIRCEDLNTILPSRTGMAYHCAYAGLGALAGSIPLAERNELCWLGVYLPRQGEHYNAPVEHLPNADFQEVQRRNAELSSALNFLYGSKESRFPGKRNPELSTALLNFLNRN
ncbi:hypothetical protein NQ318_014573 [Aromia moschata]|uniref:Uncharacterized protein n=1 Tax=Aromia moschata TaxID=1265417 RepID=A0AAV8XZX5_9CUCU|nr:hypothetical protein NQ318_014573 [Aromia moschata]